MEHTNGRWETEVGGLFRYHYIITVNASTDSRSVYQVHMLTSWYNACEVRKPLVSVTLDFVVRPVEIAVHIVKNIAYDHG